VTVSGGSRRGGASPECYYDYCWETGFARGRGLRGGAWRDGGEVVANEAISR
jgi:hypothetical protein